MGREVIEVFSRTEGDVLAIFRSDQRGFPEEQRLAVTAIRRPPNFDVTWTTPLSAMAVEREARGHLGVLHGVSVSYGPPESAPTATYKTTFHPSRIPIRALSRLISETAAYYPELSPSQIEEHLVRFINPPKDGRTKGIGFAILSLVNLVDVKWTNFKLNREPGKFESWLERAKRFVHDWI